MAKPFDATLNALIDIRPEDWARAFARLAGIPPGPATALDTDLATTLQADKLFRIDGPQPGLLHLELEANPRTGIPRELMRYNTLIDHVHDLPVKTVLILLRPKAQASDQTGVYRRCDANGELIAEFHYRVERVWQRPYDFWLNGEPGLRPLSILTDEAHRNLRSGVDGMIESVRGEEFDAQRRALIASAYVLAGLRYDRETIDSAFGRYSMLLEDSTTYQAIVEKGLSQGLSQGRTEGLHSTILRQGTKRFGKPTEDVTAKLLAIREVAPLEILTERILDATDWNGLFAEEHPAAE